MPEKTGVKDGATNPDGLPIIDNATLEAWTAEALAEPPDPQFWVDLTIILRWAAELDRRGVNDPKMPPGMTPCFFALHHLYGLLLKQLFLMRRGENCAPLMRLSSAIFDLSDGRVSPMFKPLSRKKGNPGLPSNFEIIKGTAARAMSELIEGGMPLPEAAQIVANALQDASRKVVGNITAQTVTNWRERLMQGEGPGASEFAVQAYRDSLPFEMGDTPLERGKNLVGQLRQRAAGLI
jgi:hypothetical protein